MSCRGICNLLQPVTEDIFRLKAHKTKEEMFMKKAAMVLACIGLLSVPAYPFRFGLEFSVYEQPTIGVNLRIVDFFELKPALGFSFSENYNLFDFNVDGNFYLPQIEDLQHYAGPGISLHADSNDNNFGIHGQYGLRYDFNDVLSAFGEIGIRIAFNDFNLRTFRGGAGLTVYFPNFQ